MSDGICWHSSGRNALCTVDIAVLTISQRCLVRSQHVCQSETADAYCSMHGWDWEMGGGVTYHTVEEHKYSVTFNTLLTCCT